MEDNLYHKVLDIFRHRKQSKCFFILTNKKLFKVSQEQYTKISQGYVYKNDKIKIIESDPVNGIKFEVIDNEEELDVECYNYDFLDYIYNKHALLPFLSDVLPYQTSRIENITETIKPKLTCKILYKTRINHSSKTEYLFFILQTNQEITKAILWKENLKYSSLKVGETISITKYKSTKGYPLQEHIEYNEFSEMNFFNLKEITLYELYRNNDTCITDTYCHKDNYFCDISGYISYRSVLYRRKNNGYLEYYLLIVGDDKIMLYYNSDLQFYNIEAGNRINLYNLRKLKRAGKYFYISTIFTQFEYENIRDHNKLCSSFLNETPRKRKFVEKLDLNSENQKRHKDSEYYAENTETNFVTPPDLEVVEHDVVHALDVSDVKLKINLIIPSNEDTSKVNGTFKVNDTSKVNGTSKVNDTCNVNDTPQSYITTNVSDTPQSYITTNVNDTAQSYGTANNSSKYINRFYIENAYGFLPDSFNNSDEEQIHNDKQKFYYSPFWTPKKIQLSDLVELSDNLVINECEKYLVEGKILDVKVVTDIKYCIGYVDTNSIKSQAPLVVILENCVPFVVFENFFCKNEESMHEKVQKCVGFECIIILNTFRASLDHIIYSISNITTKQAI